MQAEALAAISALLARGGVSMPDAPVSEMVVASRAVRQSFTSDGGAEAVCAASTCSALRLCLMSDSVTSAPRASSVLRPADMPHPETWRPVKTSQAGRRIRRRMMARTHLRPRRWRRRGGAAWTLVSCP